MSIEEKPETMASIRHYSSTRFAMLTVFVAITGGLIGLAHSSTFDFSDTVCGVPVLKIVGIWISITFLVFEVALDIYLSGLWKGVGVETSSFRNPVLLVLVRASAISLPVGSFFYWACVYAS